MRTPQEVSGLFRRAESAISEFEQNTRFSVSAANELRYAGRHLADYIALEDEERKQACLERAAQHCERAIDDSLKLVNMQVVSSIRDKERLYSLDRLKNYSALAFGIASLIAALLSLIGGA
ncbi:hypothetical protein [Candidatus Accumulibacter sp. ACC007]|uniref:hypothetical protein n=1 Tax=Candidatus Accumulibacter sp. ACC007 TaxID=2823333 RepID=UPI0025C45A3E|nr:hypothetical protein [Candidatus Accumulibacter sp. ACC007]